MLSPIFTSTIYVNDVDLFELATEYKPLKLLEKSRKTKKTQQPTNSNASENTPNQTRNFRLFLKE